MSMFKNFFLRKLVESKMKDVPADQREQVLAMIEKNPEFFESIAKEIQEEINSGKDQMAATMSVLQKHQDALRGMMEK